MKVAGENIIHLDRSVELNAEPDRHYTNAVYAAERLINSKADHDGRGLMLAILLSMACWAGLGIYLLT